MNHSFFSYIIMLTAICILGFMNASCGLLFSGNGDESWLQISEPNINIASGQTVQVSLTLYKKDGSKTDVTKAAAWKTNNPSIVAIIGQGQIMGKNC